jgi:hypothetical protein
MLRRQLLRGLGVTGLGLSAFSTMAEATPRSLQFPRDLGSHPDHAIEWWYITGYATAGQALYGFQITFFRSRVPGTQDLRSRLAAKHVFMAHAALTDLAAKQLHSDQRLARAAQGDFSTSLEPAGASLEDTRVQCGTWTLQRQEGRYVSDVQAQNFGLQLSFTPTQPRLFQGVQGWSRKGPQADEASYYYSEPQLQVQGRLRVGHRWLEVQSDSRAWLDHEWSNQLMPKQAVGWDWIGFNGWDGSALTAFRLRDASGQAVWAGGSFRSAQGVFTNFAAADVRFTPQRNWRSPSTGATYPVAWTVDTPVGRYVVEALLDAQELDSRRIGLVYWEGLSELRNSQGQVVGRGYLEMTGYAQALKL